MSNSKSGMGSSKPRRPGELAFVALLLIFSVLALVQAYGISQFSELSGAGVFPMLAAGTMIVSGLVILRATLKKTAVAAPVKQFIAEVSPLRFVIVVAAIVAYLVAMPSAGFVLSSLGFLFVMFAYLWRRSWFVSAIVAAASLALIYVIFRLGFQVVLPIGTWWR